jgi:L-amino acid N-acyltransferase YncA
MDLYIRKVAEADAAAIIALLNPIIQLGTYTVMDEPFSVEDQIEFIRSFPSRGIYHIAVDNNQEAVGIQDVMPISSSNVFKHVGEISTFVALDAQKQGVGQNLSRATFQAAKELGFLKLRATVRADNLHALSFYQSQGFEVIGTAKQHAMLHGKYIDEVLFEKFLR